MSEAVADAGKRAESEAPKATSPRGGAVTTSAWFGHTTWTITRRELGSYFNSPLAYILICVTLVAMGIYFFWFDGGVWQADRASVSRLMSFIPLVLSVLTIPLFTMRALSEEKRMGTIELLITMPVKDSEVILGKYFAALITVGVQLVLLFAYPLVMFKFFHLGAFDWGPFWSGMLGLLLMSAAGVAIGLMFSSMTDSQILAFFATSITLTALYAVGYVVQSLQGAAGDFIAFFSFQSRYEPFARGLIDSRAIVYFVSIAVLATLVSFRNLESRKWS